MSPELASQLFKTDPELYRARLGAGHLPKQVWGIECEDTCYQLISDLSAELVDTATRAGKDAAAVDRPEVIQVKQKFGGLRVYLGLPDDLYTPIAESYRLKSHQACEECGKPGETSRSSHGLMAACSNHRTTQ